MHTYHWLELFISWISWNLPETKLLDFQRIKVHKYSTQIWFWFPFHMIFIWKCFIWFIWFTYDATFIWFSYVSTLNIHISLSCVNHMKLFTYDPHMYIICKSYDLPLDSHMMPYFLWFEYETKHMIHIWYSYVNHMWRSCLCSVFTSSKYISKHMVYKY